jgi:hypothetical protein
MSGLSRSAAPALWSCTVCSCWRFCQRRQSLPTWGLRIAYDAVAVTIASPPVVLGTLPAAVERKVFAWVERNREVLLRYWQGEMATDDAVDLLVDV